MLKGYKRSPTPRNVKSGKISTRKFKCIAEPREKFISDAQNYLQKYIFCGAGFLGENSEKQASKPALQM